MDRTIKVRNKRTENKINLLEGWKMVRLGEVLKYQQPYKYIVSNPNYEATGVPVLTAGKSFILGYTSEKEGVYNDLPVIIFDDFTTDNKFVTFPFKVKSSAMKFLKERNKDIVLKFVYESMQLLKYENIGGDHKRRWISEFQHLNILLPPLPEQRKIAEILETIDNAIEKTERIIEKYKRLKQGLMQELLTKGIDENGQIRSEETHRFKDSPLGRIPEEWEVVELGEVCHVTSSKRIYFDEYQDDGIPFYRSKEIIEKVEGLEISQPLYISTDRYEYIKLKFGVPEPGDLLITSVGTLGVIYMVQPDDKFYFKDGNLIWLKDWNIEKIEVLFFAYLFSLVFEKQKDLLTIGTSQKALTIEKIKKMKIFTPPLSEQQHIASILSQIDETIDKEQKYKEKLERIKQGLMEDLLTGKVRVNHLIDEIKE